MFDINGDGEYNYEDDALQLMIIEEADRENKQNNAQGTGSGILYIILGMVAFGIIAAVLFN